MSAVSKEILQIYNPNKPFKWSFPYAFSYKSILEFGYNESLIQEVEFEYSKKLEIKDYNLILYSSISEERLLKLDVAPSIAGSPIVNQKVIDLLMEFCPDDFQALPVYVKNNPKDKKVAPFCNTSYFLLNTLYYVDTLDESLCEFMFFENNVDILSINKLVFKENCMDGHHLARERQYEPIVIASRDLAIQLNKHKIKGVGPRPDATVAKR